MMRRRSCEPARKAVVFFLIVFVVSTNFKPVRPECRGKENTLQPWSGNLTFVRSMDNGSLYLAGDGEDKIYVVHVYGGPYDVGYAHGVLLKNEITYVMHAFYDHVTAEIEEYIKDLPSAVKDYIARVGLDAALDATHLMTETYTPKHFYSELRGLADGSGMDYKTLLRIHMLPELVKAGCSMLGSWGKSASQTTMMTQLRALDWDTSGPLQNAPAVVVYHPEDGNAFANVGWAGWIATITGMSSKGIAISEKHSDEVFGEESRIGIPFNILMKDVVHFDNDLYEAIERIQKAHRTCSIWLGVGDRNIQSFRLVEYSKSTANFYDDRNISTITEARFEREGCHPDCYKNYTMQDLVYWGVHLDCWEEMLHEFYGRIDPLSVIQLVGLVQTGDLQAVVYDLEEMQMLVSNAKGSNESGPDNAYDRQFVLLDMKALFNQPKS